MRRNRIKIKEAIVVEGLYDKLRLKEFVDTIIITTDGFGIFKNKEKIHLLKELAEQRGLIILTDSDRAGFLIRRYIQEWISPKHIKHAYIPDIKGKEKRKATPGKEGLIGVEGIDQALIEKALLNAGCSMANEENKPITNKITKADLFHDGLSGRANSRFMRMKLARKMNLPSRISTNALLDVLNNLYSYDEYKKMIEELKYDLYS